VGGLVTLLEENNQESLILLYQLYCPIPDSLKMIADKFKIYLINQGRKLVESCETSSGGKELSLRVIMSNSQIVEKLLDLLIGFKKLINDCFKSDPLF
jgi:hypothetical protein